MLRIFLFLVLFFSFSSNAQESKIFNECLEKETISDTLDCLEHCFMLFICHEVNNDLTNLKLKDSQENLIATISINDDGIFLLEDYNTSNLTLLSALKRVVLFTSKEAEKIKEYPLNLTNKKVEIKLTFRSLKNGEIIAVNDSGKTIYKFESKKEQEESLENNTSRILSPPIYPGCKFKDLEKRKKCMSSKIEKFVVENYNTELLDFVPSLSGIVRIDVSFKININGEVSDVIAKGPYKLLEFEAVRVFNSLPKMLPGQVNGKNVTVSYSMPIFYEVENNKTDKN